jgi:hypothetical protein
MPAITATIAQNSVVFSECFVSVVSRISMPLLPTPEPARARTAGVAIKTPFHLWNVLS